MTTTIHRLSAKDFMMMDIHEPLSTEEINTINPQAAVDKTLGAVEDEVGDDASMGSAEPEHQQRCEVCFAAMPCGKHANVEQWDGVTTLGVDPTAILASAHNADLKIVCIVGMKRDGTEYFASSHSDAAESMFYLQRGIYKLNKVVDGEEVERVRQDPA